MWSDTSHSDGEQPVRRWFRDTYVREFLTHPKHASFMRSTMSFHSPLKTGARSLSRTDPQDSPRRNLRASSLSPRYLSPTVSRLGGPFEDEYVMGCSVCGTKAIEEAVWTNHKSPPRIRPSHHPELTSADGENSGAYAQILNWKGHTKLPSKSLSTHEVRLLEGKLPPKPSPFPVSPSSIDHPVGQSILIKEVFPQPSVPLTSLNYEESGLMKDSVYRNSLAERYVKEEERLRVAVRRAEYSNRVKGFTRIVEATTLRGEEGGNGEEGRVVEAGERASSSGSEAHRVENLELARKKLEEIKHTVRMRREERKSKEASLSPPKPSKPHIPPPDESDEEEAPPQPIMLPAELPPDFHDEFSPRHFEPPATSQHLPPDLPEFIDQESTIPVVTTEMQSSTLQFGGLGLDRKRVGTEWKEEMESEEEGRRGMSEKEELTEKEYKSEHRKAILRPVESSEITEKSEKIITSQTPPIPSEMKKTSFLSEESKIRSYESIPSQLDETSRSRKEEIRGKSEQPGGGLEAVQSYIETLNSRTMASSGNETRVTGGRGTAADSRWETTERVEISGSTSSRADALTDRQVHMKPDGHRRVLPKTETRKKVASARVAHVSEVSSFHRLQWLAAVRIQRAYKRHRTHSQNTKYVQTEGHDCERIQVTST